MEHKKKRLLFVINTLGRAGAEIALITLLNKLKEEDAELSLLVLTGQGELIDDVPQNVKVLNEDFCSESVLTAKGRKILRKKCLNALFGKAGLIRDFGYLFSNFFSMLFRRRVQPDKLMWRVLADTAQKSEDEYDLAVAFLEGGSTYYVAEHVKAKAKVAFIHVDYEMSGYNARLDRGCYECFDRIFAVSNELREQFLRLYPGYSSKTLGFNNIIDVETVKQKSLEPGGFEDDYEGVRLLTIGRLTAQKSIEVSVAAMKLLKDKGLQIRWYVLGEGDRRKQLEKLIAQNGLDEDFILCGAVDNPYVYLAQADIYVHATGYEGKSIAVQEAQILGKPIIASDCSGNRELINDREDGLLTELSAEEIARAIEEMLNNREMMTDFSVRSKCKYRETTNIICKLMELCR